MKRVRLKSINEGKAVINFQSDFERDGRGGGYETDVTLIKSYKGTWTATMEFGDMPPQESPQAAIDKMGKYLTALSKAMKGKHISHLNVDTLFTSKGFN